MSRKGPRFSDLVFLWRQAAGQKLYLPVAAFFYLLYGLSNAYFSEIVHMVFNLVDPNLKTPGSALSDFSFLNSIFALPKHIPPVFFIIFAIILASTLRAIGNVGGSFFIGTLSSETIHRIRTQIYEKNLTLPFELQSKYSQGELVSRITYTAQLINSSLSDGLIFAIREGLSVVAILAYLLYLNAFLTLIIFLTVPVIGLIFAASSGRFRRLGAKLQSDSGALTQIVSEGVRGFQVIKLFQAENKEVSRFIERSKSLARKQIQSIFIQSASTASIQLILSCTVAFYVYILLSDSPWKTSSPGDFAAYVTAMALLARPLKLLSDLNRVFQQSITAAFDIRTFLNTPSEEDKGAIRLHTKSPRFEFSDLSFVYEDHSGMALDRISVSFPFGSTTALVGKSGSGKSTLIKILFRLLPLHAGQLLVDGLDARQIRLSDYRSLFAYVPQSHFTFNASLKENILCGADYDELRFQKALKEAHVLEFLDHLPLGVDTPLGESGTSVSGGQAQRIAIARALYRDAPVLVLDEATSALDAESEALVKDTLHHISGQKSLILIAHRLSSVRYADQILVLDKGRLVQRGTHDTLSQVEGVYQNLLRAADSEGGV